jgi:hypothetical protein
MDINNRGTVVYPPILFIDDYAASGVKGKLQTTQQYGKLLELIEAKVTLAGTLILDGSKAPHKQDGSFYAGSSYKAVGVFYGSSFTMEGGEICNFDTSNGPIWISNRSTFTMTAGEIHHNRGGSTGAVYVGNGTFTMEGGEIHHNTAWIYSGGVTLECDTGLDENAYATFTMRAGKIRDNSVLIYSGGVHVRYGTFTMEGGEIYGNTVQPPSNSTSIPMGGGVSLTLTGMNMVFNKTGGTIYGYSSGDPKSNVVKDNTGTVVPKRGHAIFCTGLDEKSSVDDKYQDSTVSGSMSLTYTAATNTITNVSGW